MICRISVNGTADTRSGMNAAATTSVASQLIQCAANDKIGIIVGQSSGGSISTTSALFQAVLLAIE